MRSVKLLLLAIFCNALALPQTTSPVVVSTNSLPSATLNTSYSQQLTASGGFGKYNSWTVVQGSLPTGLSLDAVTGLISGTPTALGNYQFDVTVKDAQGQTSAPKFLAIQVSPPPPVINNPGTLPAATVGTAYSYTFTIVSGTGQAPFTWSVLQLGTSSGGIPGLSLSSSGVLSGTPTTAGSYSLSVGVTDGLNRSASAQVSIVVSGSIAITTASPLPQACVVPASCSPYQITLAATGGKSPYSWSISSGALPPGITLNSSTGSLSGAATQTGTYNFIVVVTDSAQGNASRAFSLTVIPQSVSISQSSLPGGSVGSSYSTSLTATGGTPPLTWSISAGNLPPGLTLNASSGVLSGVPATAGSYPITVKVADSAQQFASKAFTIVITSLPVITTSSLPAGAPGAAYSVTLAATGGTPPYSWSVTSGSLPAGITLNGSTGTLAGTPASAGSFNFTVQVTDSAQASASKAYTLVLSSALTIVTSALPTSTAGTAYASPLVATGGTPPYTWLIPSGVLPAGLLLNPNSGVIFGSVATPGDYTINVQVLDSAQQTATRTVTLSITAAVTITTAALPAALVNIPYSAAIAATGGAAPLKWSIGAGALPGGLSIAPDTGLISGTPTTAGVFNFTVQIVDAVNLTTTKALSITVTGGLSITGSGILPSGLAGSAYSQTFSALGGTAPYTWSVSAGTLPAGLTLNPSSGVLSGTPTASGVSAFTIQVKDTAQNTATQAVSLTISAVTQNTALIVSPTAVSFIAAAGGDLPAPQSIAIVSATSAIQTYVLQTDGGSAGTASGAWLSVNPASGGSVPGRLTVSVNQAGLAPGTYSARIRINLPPAAAGSQAPVDVMVSLTVRSLPPALDVAPTSLRLNATQGSTTVLEQTLLVRNAGGNGALPFTAAVISNSPWIVDLTPAAPQTTSNQLVPIRVRVNPQGLPVGFNRALIRVSSSAGNQDVPIALVISRPGPLLSLNKTGVRFEARQGNGNSNKEMISVLNRGTADSTVQWTAQIVRGGAWLNLSTAQGTATPAQPGQFVLSTNASSLNLNSGAYYALIRVSDPSAGGSPQYLTVVFTVLDSATSAQPYPAPQGLSFTAAAGGAPPAPQTISVYTSSTTPVPFQASASDATGWLAVNPSIGTASTQTPGMVNVVINTTGLKPGTYVGEVSVSIAGTLKTTSVYLTVTPAVAKPASMQSQSLDGCTPTRLSLTHIGLSNSFSVPAKWPTELTVQMRDECGTPVSNGQVIVKFDNGDGPFFMNLVDPNQALYTYTWIPARVSSAVSVTATGTASALQPGTAQLVGGVLDNKNPVPVQTPNGTVSNLSPSLQNSLAPGTIASLYGTDLASIVSAPTVVPLPTTFNGTNVLVGALEAPIFYVSGVQTNVQIPTELPPNNFYNIVVFVNDVPSEAEQIYLSPAQPGIASFQDGRVIAQHLDKTLTLVDSDHPASPGEVLTIYLAGLGATNPTVPSGTASPLAVATIPVTMTIDGKPVETSYVGLVPGGVGLYQINFTVPADAQSGDLPLLITQPGVTSNLTRLAVRRP